MTDKIREQILAIRDSGRTNMFDVNMVQRIAYESGYYELVCYLKEYRREYCHFILTGDGINLSHKTPQKSRNFSENA